MEKDFDCRQLGGRGLLLIVGEMEEKVGRGITRENSERSKVSEKKQREKKTTLKSKAGVELDVCLYDLMTHSSQPAFLSCEGLP